MVFRIKQIYNYKPLVDHLSNWNAEMKPRWLECVHISHSPSQMLEDQDIKTFTDWKLNTVGTLLYEQSVRYLKLTKAEWYL